MADDAFVEPRALAELNSQFARAGTRSRTLVADVLGEVTRSRQHIDRKVDAAVREVRRREAALRVADREDRAGAEAELRSAQHHLRDVRRAASIALEALSQLIRCTQSAQARLPELIGRATTFLANAEADLQAYLAVAMPGGSSPGASWMASAAVSAPGSSETLPNLESLLAIPLPDGWEWVPLSAISRSADLGPDEGFPKTSRAQMIEGFERLRRDILPVLDTDWVAASDRFRALDASRGIHDTSGLHGAFEAFFSTDSHIRLERQGASDGHGATNGRHRIAVARELGWPAVPVRFDGPRGPS